VNDKRIHRLWRDEGLRVPYRKRKKPLRGIGALTGQMCPIRPNVIWAADFQFDQTKNGRTIKILNIIDEFTREALATEVDRSIDADHVVSILDKIAGERGYPAYLRFDNGPEFIAYAVSDWCKFNGANTLFIDPGSPWQNGWIESFNGRMRDEHLNGQLFDTLFEAQVLTEDWRNRTALRRLAKYGRSLQPPSASCISPAPKFSPRFPIVSVPQDRAAVQSPNRQSPWVSRRERCSRRSALAGPPLPPT